MDLFVLNVLIVATFGEKMTKLRKKIFKLVKIFDFVTEEKFLNEHTDEIIKEFEKTINKVEKDYWKSLNPYLKGLPIREVFPKEMDALDAVRKELKK